MKCTLYFLVLFTLASCSPKEAATEAEQDVKIIKQTTTNRTNQAGRFSPDGEFVYNLQRANFKSNQVKSQGACTQEVFKSVFENFGWADEVLGANNLKRVSPSVAVRHNPSNYELGITVVGNSAEDYGFWLFYGSFGNMISMEVLSEVEVLPYIDRFFQRDFIGLTSEFQK